MSSPKYAYKNRVLAGLSRQDLSKYFSTLRPARLEQKRVLYDTDGPIEHIYFPEEGLASVVTNMSDGSGVEVGMIGREGFVGAHVLLGAETSDQYVVVQLAGSGFQMKAAECKIAFEQSAAVRKLFLKFIAAFLNLSAQTAACNRLHSVEQRCARWVLMASDRTQSETLLLTHEYMAAMLGVRRTGVTEVAGDLQREGLIRYQNGKINILDHGGLAATACECYALDRERLRQLLKK